MSKKTKELRNYKTGLMSLNAKLKTQMKTQHYSKDLLPLDGMYQMIFIDTVGSK